VGKEEKRLMRMKLTFTILTVAILAVFVAVPLAGAETLKWRQTAYVTKVNAIEVGDVPGHMVGVSELAGLAFFESGEVATSLTRAMWDYVKLSGPSQGYTLFTFEDGSTIVEKFQGTQTADPGGKTTSLWGGTFSFVQGSGRFAGIQGSGSYTGKRIGGPPAAGIQGYTDCIATYTLPQGR
jgi:hypothetical protein